MNKGFPLLWSICSLAALIVSCNSQSNPTPMHAKVATPNCDHGFSHLSIGQTITVVQVDQPNRVRSTPHVADDNIIGIIPSGQYAMIVDGPVCADGLVFWKIVSKSNPDASGWSAEGNGKEYWLEPYQP